MSGPIRRKSIKRSKNTKVIAIVSPKGGSGKTTLAANFGYYLACLTEEPVLLIDLHPFAHLTRIMLTPESISKLYQYQKQNKKDLFAYLFNNGHGNTKSTLSILDFAFPLSQFRDSIYDNTHLYLIPGEIKLLEIEMRGKFSQQDIYNLKNILIASGVKYPYAEEEEACYDENQSNLEGVENVFPNITEDKTPPLYSTNYNSVYRKPFSYILIDTPPSFGFLTLNALIAAHSILIPVVPEYLHISSLSDFFGFLTKVKEFYNSHLAIEGIVINKYDERIRAHQQSLYTLRECFGGSATSLFYSTLIKRTTKILEGASLSQPIFIYDNKCSASLSFAALTEEFLHKNNKIRISETEEEPAGIPLY